MNTYNNPINSAIDQFLNHSLSDVFGVSFSSGKPAVNISEDKETHMLELAVPGVPKDAIKMMVEDNKLVITAQKAEAAGEEENSDTFTRREFNYESFKRSFTIPTTADINKISAKYEDGILKVSIAKKEEAVDKGPININIS